MPLLIPLDLGWFFTAIVTGAQPHHVMGNFLKLFFFILSESVYYKGCVYKT